MGLIISTMTKGFSGMEVGGSVVNFDHLIFWVANAKTASSYFVTRFGFKPLAYREGTDEHPVVSYAVRLNKGSASLSPKIVILFSIASAKLFARLVLEGPKAEFNTIVRKYQITVVFESPTTSEHKIAEDLAAHGDFVKDIAFEVQDLDALVQKAKDQGAELVKEITSEDDDNGVLRYAVLRTYGDNTHTLIDRKEYKGTFLPGFKEAEPDIVSKLLSDTNLLYIDHVEGNMADGTLEDSISWYERNLNMQRFWCVDYKHDLSPWSGIDSGSVINKNETVLLSLNQAAKGLRPSSKASDFVKALGTSGVEHVALYTNDIVATIQALKSRGAEIVAFPPTYYTIIKEKLKDSSLKVTESIEILQENHILIDFDERGYMLQAFTKHLQARPTVFIEIIQRKNHRGFGSQNYKWVFEAIEVLGKQSEGK